MKPKILGFAGSLRKRSFNRMLLKAGRELASDILDLEIFELDGIPLFNQDLESDLPLAVRDFKERIKASDGVLVATPEYNYSIPGVLKNAIDWASRPYGQNSFYGKPLGIIGASIGMFGTARAQYHLRQVFVYLNAYVMNQPEFMLPYAEDKFDSQGNLVSDETRGRLREFLVAFSDWVERFRH